MDENIYQIAEQIVQLHQKAYEVYLPLVEDVCSRTVSENEFISLTDIAKYRNEDDPRFVIQNWMRNRNTIEFLGVWEELHNPDFNRVQFEAVKNEAGLNRFVMTPTKWITQMNAIGIVSKAGVMAEHMPIAILPCLLQHGFLQSSSYIS